MSRHSEAIENAWRIHDAQLDWTAKADAKAAFAFGLDSAALGAVVALLSSDRVLHDFHHSNHWWSPALFIVGIVCLLMASVSSAAGVAPRLKRKRVKTASQDNHIYFGHARHWTARNLQRSLLEEDLLPQLARNIVVTAEISWRKHTAVTWSLWLTVTAGVLLVAYVVFEPHG